MNKKKKYKEHWYLIHEQECVLCGAGGTWCERIYGKKPTEYNKRHERIEDVCGQHYSEYDA